MPSRIALDVVSGGRPASRVIAGAARAAVQRRDVELLLCGPRDEVTRALADAGEPATDRIGVLDAPDVVRGDEDPDVVVRGRPGASVRVAVQALKDGDVDAVVSVGTPAAAVAAARFLLPRPRGVRTPVLAVTLGLEGTDLTVLDAGANERLPAAALVSTTEIAIEDLRARGRRATRCGVLAPLGRQTTQTRELVALFGAAGIPGFVGAVTTGEALAGTVDVVVTTGALGRVLVDAVRATAPRPTGDLGFLLGIEGTLATIAPETDPSVAAAAIGHVANLVRGRQQDELS